MKSYPDYATSWKQATWPCVGAGNRLKQFLRSTTLTTMGRLRPDGDATFLKALFCHYVFDDQRVAFDAMIQYLMTLGSFVNTDTCVDMVTGRVPIDGRYFHLSFDDGFRNVALNAIPILRKHKVPAIVFVPTSLVGGDLQSTGRFCLETCSYRAPIETMKWRDLKTIVSLGFEVGSHTKSHARLSEISANPQSMREEIAGSKQQIETELGLDCKYIAWPYGKRVDSDETSLSMVEEAGYRACFGGFRGSIVPRRTNVYSIPRHHFEVQWPLSHIRYFLGTGKRITA